MVTPKESDFTEAIDTTETDQQLQIPNELPVLPLRDIVIYPFMIVPLFVSREKSIRAVDEALADNRMILLASQKDLDKEEPTAEDLYSVGTAAVIMRMLKLPDGRIRILVQGLARAQINSVDTSGEYLRANINVMTEVLSPERSWKLKLWFAMFAVRWRRQSRSERIFRRK
jgi:ATP-dependent Lon protease